MQVINIKKYACLVIGLAFLSNCLKPTFHRGKTSVASSSSSSSAANTAAAASLNFVLGQSSFTSNTAGTSETLFQAPMDVFSDGTRLYVGEATNNRIIAIGL